VTDIKTAKPAVLVFCRPYLVPDFQDNVAPLADSHQFHFITDGRAPGIRDTRERFYARMGKEPLPAIFSPADEDNVIARCRYLRHLPREQSQSMVRAMASVIAEEFERVNPQTVLAIMVDDYVTHLFSETARRRGIPFIGYCYSYFPGRSQATLYEGGVAHRLRRPDDEEVARTLAQISERTFRQNYLQKDVYTRLRHIKAMLRYQVKRVVFKLMGWRDRDPLHVHYGCLPYVVERRRWRDFPADTDFHPDWRERLEAGAAQAKPVVYMPLGYFPESTIDYWIRDKRILDYETVMLRVVGLLGKEFRVVVKEHLHMLGARNPEFYRRLRDTPGVVSVPPSEYSNDVLGLSDVVLMGAGSIGVEAYIRGKPIVAYSNESYWFAASGARYIDLAAIDTWPGIITEAMRAHTPPKESQKFEFVRECLCSTMRTLRVGRIWPICVPDDLKAALELRSPR
jgi:hypothetical protein